ncbi:MAG: hypothetical protein IH614_11350 [Desulfuromonadales bacterium]|nr:hypothetical protein [Desulfuromonadales bacterium]
MAEDLKQQMQELIRPLFPHDALVQVAERGGEVVFAAGWRLGPNRMDNWSKEIRLVIPPAVTERFAKLNDKGRSKARANLVSFVKLKLADFRPEHDHPRYLLPPQEVWRVTFEDVFPR